jgi:hypothetical protein
MSPSTEQRENREFARETKFLIDRSTADQIRAWSRTRLAPDPNASGEDGDSYQITSLYLDTEAFDIFHRRGSFGRSKYRIRRYGLSDFAFLERKLKTRGLVSKRRTALPLSELHRLGRASGGARWVGSWYEQRLLLRKLAPVCQISYCRHARVTMTENGPIRLTLDDNLRAFPAPDYAFIDAADGEVFLRDQIVLELKYRMGLPALFKELLSEFPLSSQPVSKYRLGAAALGLVPLEPAAKEAAQPAAAVQNRAEAKVILANGPPTSGDVSY